MESLSTYLVLSGYLAAGEALLLQNLFDKPLKKSKAIKLLKKAGFSDYEKIVAGLQTKQLIKVDGELYPDWEGIKIFTKKIEEKMMKIAHDLVDLKKLTEKGTEKPTKSSLAANERISIEKIFSFYKGNKITKSEKKLFEGAPLLSSIELIERLAEFGIVKIRTRKRSRSISLTTEGVTLRYLFLNKSNLNKANYEWLELVFLVPHDESWDNFLEIISAEEEEDKIPPWAEFLSKMFTELGVLTHTEDGYSLAEEQSSSPFSKTKQNQLEESVSGFIPVYVSHLQEVLVALKTLHKSKELKNELKFASSTLGGILGMLVKFELAIKGEKKYHLTPKGQELANLSENDFQNKFREHIKDNLIFSETLKFVKNSPDGKIGFTDLVGYFRASGISNFNLAKALSVLRIMSETGFGIREVEGESRSYQIIESE